MKYLRGDLSAPVLAILVTIGVIAAGLILLAWFWWFAPQAGKTGTLQILGTPAIDTNGNLYISLRNTGNANINITNITVTNATGTLIPCSSPDGSSDEGTPLKIVKPGESVSLTLTCNNFKVNGRRTVDGVITTDYGVYTFTATVIG